MVTHNKNNSVVQSVSHVSCVYCISIPMLSLYHSTTSPSYLLVVYLKGRRRFLPN